MHVPEVARSDTPLGRAGFEATDPDGDEPTSEIVWSVDGVAQAPGATLGLAQFAAGDSLSCKVVINDPYAADEATSPTLVVVNSPPKLTSLTVLPLDPTIADTLTATPNGLSDADGDASEVDIVWRVGDTEIGDGPELELAGRTKHETIVVSATPRDGTSPPGAGVAVTQSVTVANSRPSIASVTITPDAPSISEPPTVAVAATDPDGDALTTTYVWRVNGAVVPGASEATLRTGFAAEDEITVRASVDDGDGGRAEASSLAVTAVNLPPPVPDVQITPNVAGIYDDLHCTLAPDYADPDGDPLELTFDREVDGRVFVPDGLGPDSVHSGDTVGSHQIDAAGSDPVVSRCARAATSCSPSARFGVISPQVLDVSIGNGTVCALRADNTVACTGYLDPAWPGPIGGVHRDYHRQGDVRPPPRRASRVLGQLRLWASRRS